MLLFYTGVTQDDNISGRGSIHRTDVCMYYFVVPAAISRDSTLFIGCIGNQHHIPIVDNVKRITNQL